MYRILTVCLGNICRSPTAEAAIREAAERSQLDVYVESAGTGDWHVGDAPDHRMRTAGHEAGLTIDGAARQVVPADFDRFDLIVAMDHSNYRDLMDMAPNPTARQKVRMFRSFDPRATIADIPDPYFGGDQGFRDVIAMTRSAAEGLISELEAAT